MNATFATPSTNCDFLLNDIHMSFTLRDVNGNWKNQDVIPQVKKFDDFITIDWIEDELTNHRDALSKNNNIKYATSLGSKILSFAQNWLVLAAMGITIGLIAACLNVITAWLASLRFGYCSAGFYLNESFCCSAQDGHLCDTWHSWSSYEILNYFCYILISLLFSFVAAFLVKYYSPSAAGSGISEIKCIVSGFVMRGFLGWWTLLIKSIGLPLAIGSGLSVGKEGPSVHYAVCVGNSIAKLFQKYRKSASKAREFLTASSAAGVAVAFGSPMGGVLFSMEEISNVFQLSTIIKSYFCALVAVGTLAFINPFRTGQLVIFEVDYDTNWHYFDIPIYIILGIFGGCYGIIVSKFNIKVVSFRKRYLANFAVREVFILTLFTAIICYFNEFLRLDMTESMELLFHECDKNFKHLICDITTRKTNLVVSLLFATVFRMFLTVITYGCKVPAGIFVPSMAAGATFGRALGVLMAAFYENNKDSKIFSTCTTEKCVIPGTYAFLGAAAALSGITDLTVTVAVIMFELTGAMRYIIPTMIVVAVTKVINDRWGKGGIADQMIKFNGLPLIDPKEDFTFNTTVTSAMTVKTVAIPVQSDTPITLSKLRNILNKTSYRGYPLVESEINPKIFGYVTTLDLNFALEKFKDMAGSTQCSFVKSDNIGDVDLSPIVNPSPLTVSSDTTLEYILDVFVKVGPRYMLVQEDGVLVGTLTRKDILRYEYTLHHEIHGEDADLLKDRKIEEKVWEAIMLWSTNFKKNIGKLLHNDANRYL